MGEVLQALWQSTGLSVLTFPQMLALSRPGPILPGHHKYEPLLLVPIAFGVWLATFRRAYG